MNIFDEYYFVNLVVAAAPLTFAAHKGSRQLAKLAAAKYLGLVSTISLICILSHLVGFPYEATFCSQRLQIVLVLLLLQ